MRQLEHFLVHGDQTVLPKDTAASFAIYPVASLVRGMAMPLLFNSIQTFGETTGTWLSFRGPNRRYRLLLDLPAGVEIYSLGPFTRQFAGPVAQGPSESPRGRSYRRYTIPYHTLSPCGQLPLYLTTMLPPGEYEPGYYHLQWDGGEQAVEKFPVRVYEKPRVKGPRRFIAGVYLHLQEEANVQTGSIFEEPQQGPALLADFHSLGLNTIVLNNVWAWRPEEQPGTVKFITQARQAGMEVAMHVSGFSNFETQAQREQAQSLTIDGKPGGGMCPSYRGPAYQVMIRTWGGVASDGIYWLDNDFEDWNYREHTICFCPRCQEGFRHWLLKHRPDLAYRDPQEVETRPGDFPDLHQAWFAFKNSLIAEWHRDLRAELERNMARAGVRIPGFPRLGITESETDWDWKMLTDSAVDYISPMHYAYLGFYPEPSVESCSRRFLDYRKRVGVDRSKYIVTIAPGERTGEVLQPDKAMMYQVLELAASGAAGFKIWYEQVMNGGQYYWLARALRMIQPVEDILLDGTMSEERSDTPNARVRFFRHEQGTVLFVAEYGAGKTELKVQERVRMASVVRDLDDGEKVATLPPEGGSLQVPLEEDRVRLLFIGTEEQWRQVERGRGAANRRLEERQ